MPTDAQAKARGTARRRRASGIYGTVVTAAVLASAGSHLTTAALAAAVFVTLVVYWGAEQYAEILGEQAEHGRLPTWPTIRAGMASTWSMVSSAYLPVVALIICRLFGASRVVAANAALLVAVVLLLFHGWSAGRAAEMHGVRLLSVTLIAGSLGVLMIILKNLVVTNLHWRAPRLHLAGSPGRLAWSPSDGSRRRVTSANDH